MYIRNRETSTNSYERPMYEYRFRLLCCYTQINDEYFGGSMVEPYWIEWYVNTSGMFWEGVMYWSVSMEYRTAEAQG